MVVRYGMSGLRRRARYVLLVLLFLRVLVVLSFDAPCNRDWCGGRWGEMDGR